MEAILDGLSWALIAGGLFFMIVGTVGILRMPDVLTRMHAAGMTDTLGALGLLAGMALQAGFNLVLVRLVFIWLLLLFTSPISGHALARAALQGGHVPWTRAAGGAAESRTGGAA
ncbi:MAG TPA: monovalent cation/H(+) antiporter subunit G [Longimicrobiales bacterium]|nr:monovalent cation/H(+) antiporter subunit G [Longimicrobiales bacterium]